MSAETQVALHAALRAHVPGTELGAPALREAAAAHAADSRPYEDAAAEYVPLLEPGATYDPGEFAELAEELQAIRVAKEVMAGHLPGYGPIVTTEG